MPVGPETYLRPCKTFMKEALRKACPYLEFFWSVFFPAFGLNTDQRNSKYGHFSRSEVYCQTS